MISIILSIAKKIDVVYYEDKNIFGEMVWVVVMIFETFIKNGIYYMVCIE